MGSRPLYWLQIISTNDPIGGGATSPYVDPLPNAGGDFPADAFPFYYDIVGGSLPDDDQRIDGVYHFYDRPSRPIPEAPPGGGMSSKVWNAELYLTSWDGTSTVIDVYDGIAWGFQLSYYEPFGGGIPPINPSGGDDRSPVGMNAVPEPSSVVMSFVAGAFLTSLRLVLSRRNMS
jgi:hypothetical protein